MANQLDEVTEIRRRLRLPITIILAFGFGALMLAAVVSVLFLGLSGAQRNTATLLRDKVELTLQSVVDRIAGHLQPVEAQARYIAEAIGRGEVDLGDREALRNFMFGALAPTPQVTSVLLVRPDASVLRFERSERRIYIENWAEAPAGLAMLEEARTATEPSWAEPTWAPPLRQSVLPMKAPIHGPDGFVGLLVAAVTITELSDYLTQLSRDLGQTAFVLYDHNSVLAYPSLDGSRLGLSGEHPLPTLEDVGDPVLARLWSDDRQPLTVVATLSRAKGYVLPVGGEDHVIIHRDFRLAGPRPWLVGTHFPAARANEEVLRLRWMAIGGVGLLVLFLAATVLIGRRLSAPISELAVAATRIRELEFREVRPLKDSWVREYSEAATAFNAMVRGLRWFEAYLPRTLVSRLIAQGDSFELQSQEREVTVMFTDIVGFSGMAEARSAAEIAAFLNDHFTLLNRCIEATDGTIDKYIGDSVMAFWGAPIEQPDHAVRACRAAKEIAAAIHAENTTIAEQGRPPVRVRIGIHSGRVIVGNIGSPGRLNYTLVGDVVNTAQRLEQLGKEVGVSDAVTILLSETTADALPPEFATRDQGRWILRGRDEEVSVRRLV